MFACLGKLFYCLLMTNAVSRQLRNGKLLVITVVGDQIVTTIDGVRSAPHCGGRYSSARPYKLPTPVEQSFGVATWAMGEATGVKIALSTAEAERIIAAVTPPAPLKPRNPPCHLCGSHCYGDCTANT